MNAIVGNWGDKFDTGIIGIHQVMMEDGRVFYWGGDGNGAAFSNTQKFGIYDPATGEHEILDAGYAVRMFCGAGVVLPGTDKVLIAGGNGSGQAGGQLFDLSEGTLTRDGADDMANGRFYPTMVTLSSGQAVIMGGNGNANLRGTPEIFTLGEGWRQLEGAADADLGNNWWYPRAWVNKDGEIVYFAISAGGQGASKGNSQTKEVMALDPTGEGSIRQIGELPFNMDVTSPSAMYDVGKIVIMADDGDLWTMDINGDAPVFAEVADLNGDRNNSDMTVMADGRVLINGGTTEGNSQDPNKALLESVMFDPFTGEVTVVDAEDVMRLYHSSSTLLNDGTILSMGGGGLGGTVNFMDAQVYTPDYLYNDDGTLADRPEITGAPDDLEPGETFTITMDDTSDLARMSFVKTGAVTHSLNMESGRMDLDFDVVNGTTVEVTLPDNPNVVGAGNWMLFAIDDAGVPSIAPLISVEPTLPLYTEDGGPGPVDPDAMAGLIEVDYFNADVIRLDDVNFNANAIYSESVTSIQQNVGNGAFFVNGPTDKFAAQYDGEFEIAQTGNYTFYLTSDDGSNLSIDGKEIIDNDFLHADVLKTATVRLEAGVHTLDAQYFEQGGQATMDLDWSGPGFSRTAFEVDGLGVDGGGTGGGGGGPVPGDGVADIANVTQYLTGSNAPDNFIINGNAADYGWGATLDGEGIVVWGPTGHDLLYDFDTITFNDKVVKLTNETAPGGGVKVADDPTRTQYETGTDKTDIFTIAGKSSDYGWGETQDGQGIVVWNVAKDTHDLLYDFEQIEFTDETIDLEAEFA